MTRKDRCSYRWKRLERKSTRRRRGGTIGSGLAAERGIGVQRVEAVPVPAQADGSHRQSPSCQKTVGSETFRASKGQEVAGPRYRRGFGGEYDAVSHCDRFEAF